MSAAYVALGDSYAAGVGGGDRVNACWRAPEGYPVAVAHCLGADLAWQACIAATILDVRRHQLGVLDEDTRFVTITVGGNDIGFTPVLISAAQPSWMSDTHRVIDGALRLLREELPGRLAALYEHVRRSAPNAEVIVTTYPRLFAGSDCSIFTFFDDDEIARLNSAAEELAATSGAAAEAADFACVDVLGEFEGHGVCSADEWIHGVSWPIEESFHPSRPGHAAYARLIAERWGCAPVPAVIPDVRVAQGPKSEGSAPTFALPDLLSTQSLQGALEHGLDPNEVADLARRADEDPEARPRLRELDRLVRERRG